MSQVRIILASTLACLILVAGLAIITIRPGHTQAGPIKDDPSTKKEAGGAAGKPENDVAKSKVGPGAASGKPGDEITKAKGAPGAASGKQGEENSKGGTPGAVGRGSSPHGASDNRQVFAVRLHSNLRQNESENITTVGTAAKVPAGKTMFVEYASSNVSIPAGQHLQIILEVSCKGMDQTPGVSYNLTLHGPEIAVPSADNHTITISHPLGIHLQAGDTFRAALMRPSSETSKPQSAVVFVHGYLE